MCSRTSFADSGSTNKTSALHGCFSFLFHFFLSGPINREMRHLISTLQTHNQQMKGEVVKYKIRLRETQAELNQVGPVKTKSVRNGAV